MGGCPEGNAPSKPGALRTNPVSFFLKNLSDSNVGRLAAVLLLREDVASSNPEIRL